MGGHPMRDTTYQWNWDRGQPGAGSARLAGWSDGYTTDATYQDLVNVDLTPAWFSMISVLNGQPPLDLDGPLVWLDVACGPGLATVTVAAANPNVQVWGVDYNPGHIERARNLAAACGLTNCHFIEASFEQLSHDPDLGPTEVDVVVVNGVYSWVSKTNQAHIVEVIGQRLRSGGLAYVMYETAPGWASVPPLAEAMRLWVDADGRPGHLAFHEAAGAVNDVLDAGALVMPLGRRETTTRSRWASDDPHYAAHEYLGSNFGPLHADEVFTLMATEAKCSLLSGIAPLDNHPYFSVPIEVADLLNGATDPVLATLIADLVMERALRRDLFRRGRLHPTATECNRWLDQLTIRGMGRKFDDKLVELDSMRVTLDPAYHQRLVDALTETDLNVAAVLAIHPDWTRQDAISAMCLLVTAGYATPCRPGDPPPAAIAGCQALNSVLMVERSAGRDHACVASPATGSMIPIDLVEVLALDAVATGTDLNTTDLADHVSNHFDAHGLVVRQDNELIHDRTKGRQIIETRVETLLGRLDALRRHGVI